MLTILAMDTKKKIRSENTAIPLAMDGETFRDVAIYAVENEITMQKASEELIKIGLSKNANKITTQKEEPAKIVEVKKCRPQVKTTKLDDDVSFREKILEALPEDPENALLAVEVWEKIRSDSNDPNIIFRERNHVNGTLSSLAKRGNVLRVAKDGEQKKFRYYVTQQCKADKRQSINDPSQEDIELLITIRALNKLDDNINSDKIVKTLGHAPYTPEYVRTHNRLRRLYKNGLINRKGDRGSYIFSLTKDGYDYLNDQNL